MPEIRGVVLNKHTKRPLAGAIVCAEEADAVSQRGSSIETDAAGIFRLAGIEPASYRVFAQFDVRAAEAFRFSFSGSAGPINVQKDDVEIVVEVDVRGAVVGRVLDAVSGVAVRGALVRILEDTGGSLMAATEEGGRYTLGYINPGSYTMTCESEGYERYLQKIYVGDASLTGVLTAPIFLIPLPVAALPDKGIVRGMALNEVGNPAVGTEVTLLGEGLKQIFVVTRNYFDYQLGHYEFRDLPEGKYRIVAIRSGMQPAETEVIVSRGKVNWAPDLTLRSLPYVTPPEVEYLGIEPPSVLEGENIKIKVRLTESIHRVAYVSGNVIGPAGWSMGFAIDDVEPDGTFSRTFVNWRIPGLFVLTKLMVQNKETGKGFELPVNAKFEVVPRDVPPLSPDSPLFKSAR